MANALQPTKQLAGLVSGNTARYPEDDATHVILIAGPAGAAIASYLLTGSGYLGRLEAGLGFLVFCFWIDVDAAQLAFVHLT